MFWAESQFPLAIFILKGVKCLFRFHQVTCWCFSSNRCCSWNEAGFPPWGNRLMSALGGSRKLGRSWRYQLKSRLMVTVVHQWLPVCPWHTDLALQIISLLCFQRCPWYQSSSSFSSLFPCLHHWVQLGAKGQHWAPLTSGFRSRQSWMWNLEFPVWVLGRLLGIPILITNFLFQLRSLPDKLEPNTRCVTNCCLPFCSFAAPCNNRLWTCRAVQKLHLGFLVKNLFVPGFLLWLLLLRNVCVH